MCACFCCAPYRCVVRVLGHNNAHGCIGISAGIAGMFNNRQTQSKICANFQLVGPLMGNVRTNLAVAMGGITAMLKSKYTQLYE